MYVAAADQPGGLAGLVVDIMDELGGPGAALLVGIDNIFPPMPSELVLPLAGFAASQGTMSLFMALFWTTLGSVGKRPAHLLAGRVARPRPRALSDQPRAPDEAVRLRPH